MKDTENIAIFTEEDVRKLEADEKFRFSYHILYPGDTAKLLRSTKRELANFMIDGDFPVMRRVGFEMKRGYLSELKGFLFLDLIRWAVQNNRAVNLDANYFDFEARSEKYAEFLRRAGLTI